jgi:hypothetical protein
MACVVAMIGCVIVQNRFMYLLLELVAWRTVSYLKHAVWGGAIPATNPYNR